MKRFTVPCLYFGKTRADFNLYIGDPNDDYDALAFQTHWLLTLRQGVVPEEFLQWLKEMRIYSLQSKLSFQMVCADTMSQHYAAFVDSQRQTDAEQRIIDLASSLKEKVSSAPGKPQPVQTSNMLRGLWNTEPEQNANDLTKENVICYVCNAILSTASKSSKACRQLLPFLLSNELKSLSDTMKDDLDFRDVSEMTYSLAVVADTQGKFIDVKTLKGLQKFLRMPMGDQLLAIVELRNALEEWSLSPKSFKRMKYDLTEFRNDLQEYFLPQQWKKKRKPTAQEMYMCAWSLRSGKKGCKSLLGELAWTLKAGEAGDITAQCAIGYYFGKCGDGDRYLYWTKRAAEGGLPQAIYNLGSSYAAGQDGLRKNLRIGLKYLLKAAKLKHRDAPAEIGWSYIQLGEYKNAKKWLEKAVKSKQRDDFAYSHLGDLYKNGWGVPKSEPVALGYYMTAGDMGHEYAQEAAQRVRGKPILFDLLL